MRHVILGAGGVGGFIAACLTHVGEGVTVIVRPDKLAAQPPQIQLESTLGNWSANVDWSASVPSADVLWLTIKATQLEDALRSITKPESIRAVVPLLNGIDHLAILRSKFGADRVIPATIAGEFERVSAGHFVHRTPFAVLNLSARGRELLDPAVEKLRAIGLTCNFVDDEITLMWSKLVFLAPIALTTSAFDRTVGEVMADAKTRQQIEDCVREACAVAEAEGAKVDADAVLKLLKNAPFGFRSSMQKDLANDRALELDAIGGAVVRAAKRHGLSVPATEALMTQITERIEKRSSTINRAS
ncbi:MAG: ketopantoate reductase family protein [Terriglobales bacterium]